MQEDTIPQEVIMTNRTLEDLLKEIEEQNDVEAKLKKALEFMEIVLSSGNTPDFKSFWELRKKSLDLFKEQISPVLRSQFWNQFSHLSKEARRIKDQLDEQSDFAAEQIDMAIQAIEKDIQEIAQKVESSESIQIPESAHALDKKFDRYNSIQKELNLLNVFASRINALRKELIKTEMRIRTKNQFFERLSKTGDSVFPRRKELIQEISQIFEDDVEAFITANFLGKEMKKPLFELREEIKALQSVAKYLTLNTHAFSQTRFKLSGCWDQIKEKDKERKQEFEKKKEIFKVHFDEIKGLIDNAQAKFESGEASLEDTQRALEQIVSTMRSIELSRDDVKTLRDLIQGLRNKVQEKQKAEEDERLIQDEIRQKQKRELKDSLELKIRSFVANARNLSIEDIQQQKEELVSEIQKASLNKSEKGELERSLRAVNELVQDKREEALLNLPSDERQALEQLNELLSQKVDQRNEIKAEMETLRKAKGSSGLDIQKAMEFNERLSSEKEKLEKALAAIRDLEQKIEELENRNS